MSTTSSNFRLLAAAALPLALAACATTGTAAKKPTAAPPAVAVQPAPAPAGEAPKVSPYAPAQEDLSKRGDYVAGGLFRPGVADTVPDYIPDVDAIPEPEVRDEPRSRGGNRAYSVLGKSYKVMDSADGYVEEGGASYYGNKFHGRRTSNQEVYDMYAFTAAHKTLPLPSFARVTNLDNGKSVVVRVNDRGPFHEGRVIDLSYAAAVKLGIVARGTGRVEVRALAPGEAGSSARTTATTATTKRAGDPSPGATTAPATASTAALPATGLDNLVQALPSTTGSFGQAQVSVVPVPAATRAAGGAPVPVAGGSADSAAVLQVASFSSLENARRALDRLAAAGIAGGRLDDVVAGGRTLWRLRVAAGGADLMELAGRIAGLGLGTPQLVRD